MPNKIEYQYGEMVGSVIFLHDVDNFINPNVRKGAFRCDCGRKFISQIYKVKTLETQSCGCLRLIATKKSNSKHGLSNKHKLYGIWKSMKARCYNPNANQYKDYGGRGVIVCDEWKGDFLSFFKWCLSNGYKRGLQLDKDCKGYSLIYSPNTCSFVLPKENSNRRRSSKYITYKGETRTVSEWATTFNISLKNLYQRLSRGWNTEKCFTYGN